MFDTGYDFDHVMRVLPFEKPIQDTAQTIPGQLALLGLKPSDINYVINSHYHFDHCGGNKHLHEACTICHARELEACGNLPALRASRLFRSHLLAGDRASRRACSCRPIRRSTCTRRTSRPCTGDQEIAKGVWLFETPGHTAGHYSLMVELEEPPPDAVHRRCLLQQEEPGHDVHLELPPRPGGEPAIRCSASRSSPRSTTPSCSTRTTWRASRPTRPARRTTRNPCRRVASTHGPARFRVRSPIATRQREDPGSEPRARMESPS